MGDRVRDENTESSEPSGPSASWRRSRAMDLLHEAHDAIEKAMRVLGHLDDGCRLGDARQRVVDVMEDLRA